MSEPYRPRETQQSVLVRLLRMHLDDFLERAAGAAHPTHVPPFVERQLRAMVDCGDLTRGFVRLACSSCSGLRVVPFSCKGRLCPSCGGRRMSEQAAHLVDRVLPRTPYRQWVLTLPWELARAVAFDAKLSSQLFALFADELGRWYRAGAEKAGIASPQTGCVLEIQRFADGARLWPHGHALVPEGVFVETEDGRVRFHKIRPPRDEDVEAIVTRIEERIATMLSRRRDAAERRQETDDSGTAQAYQLLLQCSSLGPADRVLINNSGGQPPRGPSRRRAARRKHLCVRTSAGLELHADVHVAARERSGLERLCRYLARPPLPEERLSWQPDGRIEIRLKRTWKGGVRALLFEPHQLIARLAALIPLPRSNLRRFYGVFAANHPLRERIVPKPPDPAKTKRPVAPERPAQMGWADLLKRTWNIDAMRCPYCSHGLMYVIAVVLEPDAITAIIAAVHAASEQQQPPQTAPRGPPDDRHS